MNKILELGNFDKFEDGIRFIATREIGDYKFMPKEGVGNKPKKWDRSSKTKWLYILWWMCKNCKDLEIDWLVKFRLRV